MNNCYYVNTQPCIYTKPTPTREITGRPFYIPCAPYTGFDVPTCKVRLSGGSDAFAEATNGSHG